MKSFGHFRLDSQNRCLWYHGKRVALTPKAFSLLCLLVDRAGTVVSHLDLLDIVWRNQVVQQEVLKKYVMELRRVLAHDESADAPRIENVPRIGYMLCTSVSKNRADSGATHPATLVERDRALTILRGALNGFNAGAARVVFVSGEAGLGKTVLLQAFFSEAKRQSATLCAWATCTEHGRNDAFLPFLDAMHGLSRDGGEPSSSPATHQWEPFLETNGPDASQLPMKFRLASHLHSLAQRNAVVLFMDDAHWADDSSMELLSHLVSNPVRHPLLIVCAYRPSEVHRLGHPLATLRLQFTARGYGVDCELSPLSVTAIRTYVHQKMARNRFDVAFYDFLLERTEGNPLFLSDLVEYLRDQGEIRTDDGVWENPRDLHKLRCVVPSSTASMVDLKVRLLGDDDRYLLLVAALQGLQFNALVVARAMQQDPATLEERLVSLANRHALIAMGSEEVLPIGHLSLRFEFAHGLYRDAVIKYFGPARRSIAARDVAHAMEWAYEGSEQDIYSQVAELHLLAMEHKRAAQCFLLAARTNAARYAGREAYVLAERGLSALSRSRGAEGEGELETELQLIVGSAQTILVGWPNELSDAAYRRAQQLSSISQDSRARIGALYGTWNGFRIRGDLVKAAPLAKGLLQVTARDSGWPKLLAWQSNAMTDLFAGNYRESWRYARAGVRAYSEAHDKEIVELFQRSAGASLYATCALGAWVSGWPATAVHLSRRAEEIALALNHPASIASALGFRGFLCILRVEPSEALSIKADFDGLRDDEALSNWRPVFAYLAGWAAERLRSDDNGIEQMRRSLADFGEAGVRLGRIYLMSALAEAYLRRGHDDDAKSLAKLALEASESSGEGHGRPSLWLIMAEASARRYDYYEASEHYQQALAVAREQHALAFEARVLESATRLLPDPFKCPGWQARLESVQRWLCIKQSRESLARSH